MDIIIAITAYITLHLHLVGIVLNVERPKVVLSSHNCPGISFWSGHWQNIENGMSLISIFALCITCQKNYVSPSFNFNFKSKFSLECLTHDQVICHECVYLNFCNEKKQVQCKTMNLKDFRRHFNEKKEHLRDEFKNMLDTLNT